MSYLPNCPSLPSPPPTAQPPPPLSPPPPHLFLASSGRALFYTSRVADILSRLHPILPIPPPSYDFLADYSSPRETGIKPGSTCNLNFPSLPPIATSRYQSVIYPHISVLAGTDDIRGRQRKIARQENRETLRILDQVKGWQSRVSPFLQALPAQPSHHYPLLLFPANVGGTTGTS